MDNLKPNKNNYIYFIFMHKFITMSFGKHFSLLDLNPILNSNVSFLSNDLVYKSICEVPTKTSLVSRIYAHI